MNQELVQYLQQQLRTADERLRRFTHSREGKRYPQRFMYVKIKGLIGAFLKKQSGSKMVIIPGFRGVGKTTLMAQVCANYRGSVKHTLFLSIEEAVDLFDAGISDLMVAFETILGEDLERMKEPVLVFLDEVQSDPKWAAALKALFEKTTNVFVCCTGSSALMLQTTTNVARRALFEKMPPLCFTEYIMIKHDLYPPSGVKEAIRKAVYFSGDAAHAHATLQEIRPVVLQYWTKIHRTEIRSYLASGTLPYSLLMPNDAAVYDSISMLLDKIISQDLPKLGNFNPDTLGIVKRLLFAIAENDVSSLNVLEQRVGVNRLTLANIFDALEKAEVLIKIPAHGSNMTVAKKPNKYLFMSPAMRMSFFYFTGQESTYATREGKLLEDSVGSHLYREFILRGQGSIRYDSAQGGADFILQILQNRKLIIEVGMGSKDRKQIIQSTKKISSKYNIILSDNALSYDHGQNILFVPLEYYFMM